MKRLAQSEGEDTSYLSVEAFEEKFGTPPWELVNSIFETAQLGFRINQPYPYDDRPFDPVLTDVVSGIQIRFGDLSSGEKILMSFALCLYYAQDRRQLTVFPKILLFDEIDAPLHPSMTQSLLTTIENILVRRYNIAVIMATHSPSTVALAPEASLFAMKKDTSKRIHKVSKDGALAVLTAGVPTLSINYKNRRQVFVESQNDVNYYERLYAKLKERLTPEISLNFIASGVGGKGNSDQVREVVNQLFEHGSDTVYGIIDWDLKNSGNQRVKVLGEGSRYSIENYVLDPILLAALLLREKFIDRSVVGLSEKENYTELTTFEGSRLQTIADAILKELQPYVQIQDNEVKHQCMYVNGQTVELPRWFLRTQGHQLETHMKTAFPKLRRYQGEADLKNEVLLKVVDDIPGLIPTDLLQLFDDIQNIRK